MTLKRRIIRLGQECAVGITGWPGDAAFIKNVDTAFAAINAALEEGRRAVNERNGLLAFKRSVDEALNSGKGVYRP